MKRGSSDVGAAPSGANTGRSGAGEILRPDEQIRAALLASIGTHGDSCRDPGCPVVPACSEALRHLSDLVLALEVIGEALRDPDGGSYWPARAFLDRFDVCHIDLNDTRVLLAVVCLVLKRQPTEFSINLDDQPKPSPARPPDGGRASNNKEPL